MSNDKEILKRVNVNINYSFEDLYKICNAFIYDCNRNECLKLLKNTILPLNESQMNKILNLYEYQYEKELALKILKNNIL